MSLSEEIKKEVAVKITTKIVLIVVGIVAVIGIIALLYYNPFNWNISFSKDRFPKIADTKNVVEHVKTISEFTTACYYEEFVVQESKIVAKENMFSLKKGQIDSVQNEIVIILKGKVRAGFDLSKMTENDLCATNDTLTVLLPAPELFDVIINPSDYEIFVEEGKWSHDEIQTFQNRSKEYLLAQAQQENILDKAKKEGRERLGNLFKNFGYNSVIIEIKE